MGVGLLAHYCFRCVCFPLFGLFIITLVLFDGFGDYGFGWFVGLMLMLIACLGCSFSNVCVGKTVVFIAMWC